MKRIITFMLAVVLALAALAGCSRSKTEDAQPSVRPEKKPIQTDVNKPPYPYRLSEEEAADLLESLPEQFMLSSGAGGWGTALNMNADWTFNGFYQDAELSLSGEEYPDGTYYVCNFSGSFVDITRMSNSIYKMKLKNMSTDNESGDDTIEHGVRYIYSDPLGVEEGNVFYLYMPGTDKEDLPRGLFDWYFFEDNQETLPDGVFALYNADLEAAFIGQVS